MVNQAYLLWRLAVRDIRRKPVESAMVFVMIAAAAVTLTVAFALAGVTNNPYQQTRAATHGPDVIAEVFSGLPQSSGNHSAPSAAGRATGSASGVGATIASLIHAAGVTAHSGPFPSVYGTVELAGRRAAVVAEGRDRSPAAVDQPKLTAGSWIRPGGVVLERGFAEALGAHVGDRLRLDGRMLRVVGIAVTAAVPAYPSSLCHLACLMNVPARMGFVWVSRELATRLGTRAATTSHLIDLRLGRPSQAAAFVAARNGSSTGTSVAVLYSWQSVRGADGSVIEVEQIALQFGGWLLELLALAGLTVLVGRRMTEQARRVGLLKAVGATPGMVAAVLLVEHLVVGGAAAIVGLAAGRLLAPLIASPGAGLLGAAGAPSMSALTTGVIAVVALGVAAGSALVPAVQAARTSTIAALADAPRVPRRRPLMVAVSGRLPVTLLIGVRQLARRPRRALLGAASVGVTVTGVVAILTSSANAPSAGAGAISNLKIERLDELMQIITVMLVILAGLNTTFIGWATATDGRFTTALERALGATRRQVTAGLSIAALIPALPAALVGVPLGILVYHLLDQGSALVTPPVWELLGVVLASSFAVVLLTAIPSRWGSQRAPAQILQSQ